MNGWIIVGTKVDTKELDGQLKNLEKDLIKYGKEYEGLLDKKAKIELNVDFKNYLNAKAKLEDLEAKYQEAKKTVGTIDLSQPGSANLYNNAVEKMSSLRSEMAIYQSEVKNGEKAFEGQIIKLDEINQKIDENIEKQKAVKTEVSKINEKLSEVKRNEMLNSGFNGIKSSIDSVGNSVENTIKKVSRWALAIFGVRSAYMFVRQAMSTLSQYDDQMAVNIEWIRYLLASALKPIIETIINLAYKLLVYINYISQAWFGVNLFANASAKAFEKQHKAIGGSVKKAKELQKTLAGFDEMNVLQKNGDTSPGGGGGGVSLPSFPKMEDVPIPDWIKWIAKNKDLILSFLAALTAGLLALKLGLKGIQALGIGIAVFGLITAIKNLIKFLKDPTFDNFLGILKGIAITVAGIAIAVEAWPVAVGAAVAAVIILIVKHFDKIKSMFNDLIKWMDKNFLGGLRYLFGPLGDVLYAPIAFFVRVAKGAFDSFFGGIKKVIEGVVKLFKGDFLGGIKDVFHGLLSIMLAPLNGFVNGVKDLWNRIKGSLKGMVSNINNVLSNINPINLTKNAALGIGSKIKSLFGFSKGGIVKLASGAIINQPGRGVPISSAIGGERGMEGIIPLTDSQQMMLLGEAIGKYVTINANITNNMNGRVISRELQKVQNESDFAFNR